MSENICFPTNPARTGVSEHGIFSRSICDKVRLKASETRKPWRNMSMSRQRSRASCRAPLVAAISFSISRLVRCFLSSFIKVLTLAGVEVVAYKTGKPRRVALVEGFDGCLNHLLLRDVLPRNRKAVFVGKMVDKLPLRPSVALAERMKRIDFTKIASGSLAKTCLVQSRQVIFRCEFRKNGTSRADNVRVVGKITVTLG